MATVTIFERLSQGRSSPIEKPQEISPAQALLNWLQRWNKDFVSARDIRIYGPHPIRNQKDAVATARILVRNGQLTPIGSRKPYLHKWRIVR
jgi:hypothetical protein